MPKRVIDFDAMWGSDKLASCADWAQAEYAWLYGLADASGCFEMTNLRVIWGRVAAVRGNFTIERLEQVFREFQDKGLLFVWMHEGKRYAHWTGSDVPGRLPPPSWRMRLEKFAPPVPKLLLAEYMARFARGRAALAGAGFRGESAAEVGRGDGNLKFEISDLKCSGGRDGGDSRRGDWGVAVESGKSEGNLKFEISDLKCSCGRDGGGSRVGNRGPAAGSGKDDGNLKFEISDLKCSCGRDGGDSRIGNWGTAAGIEDLGVDGRGEGSLAGNWRNGDEGNLSREKGLKDGVEGNQAQDLNLDLDLKWNGNGGVERGLEGGEVLGAREVSAAKNQIESQSESQAESKLKNGTFYDSNARAEANAAATATAKTTATANAKALTGSKERSNTSSNANPMASSSVNSADSASANSNANADGHLHTVMKSESREFSGASSCSGAGADFPAKDGFIGYDRRGDAGYRMSAREIAVERELRVGTGPVCGPVRIRPEVLERIRLREEARNRARSGMRAP